jgi:hypothetical protein
MTANDLQWTSLSDFRPGIKGRINPATISQSKGILGAANKSGTFRCYALEDGSLAPLPKRTGDTTLTLPVASASTSEGRLSLSGFLLSGPINDGVEAHIAWEACKPGPPVRRFIYWQRVRLFSSNQQDTLYSADPTVENPAPTPASRPVWFQNYRAHASDPTLPGTPCVVGAWAEGDVSSGLTNWWKIWPDPTTATSNTPGDIVTANSTTIPILHFIHQGRSCIVTHNLYSHGSLAGTNFQSNEEILFTNVNLKTVQNASAAQVFGMENAVGVGMGLSTSHSEVLLIKSAEGGLFVRGDIADPTVLRLPGVPNALNHMPANTPLGAVYLSNDGAFLWNGGEQADNISKNTLIGDDFVFSTDFVSFRGRVAYWRDWVIFPNNWCWDYRNDSWWRLDDPTSYQGFYFQQNIVNGEELYSAPAYVVTGGTAFTKYAYNTPATEYEWVSLPIPMGTDRRQACREVVVVATGIGSVAVTLTDTDGTTHTGTANFTSSSVPQLVRLPFNARFHQMRLKLVVTATTTVTPVVHEVRFGMDERTHAPNS